MEGRLTMLSEMESGGNSHSKKFDKDSMKRELWKNFW